MLTMIEWWWRPLMLLLSATFLAIAVVSFIVTVAVWSGPVTDFILKQYLRFRLRRNVRKAIREYKYEGNKQ